MPDRTLGLRAGAIAAFTACALLVAGTAGAQERTLTSSRQLLSTDPLRVEVESGAGTLTIGSLDGEALLYRMNLSYDEQGASPVAEFDSASGTLRLGLSGRPRGGRDREGSEAEIQLSRNVPIDLALRFGAGKAELDLTGLKIEGLRVETGASETSIRIDQPNELNARLVELKAGAAELRVTGLGNLRSERIVFEGGVGRATLDFSGAWTRDATANLNMGIGALVLRFPRSLGVSIDRNSFLTRFAAHGFDRRDGREVSNNWDDAEHRLTVDLSAALGSVEVHWIGD